MSNDPRMVIDYGKYVGPGKNKDSIGNWIAFLAVYAGLREADYGGMSNSEDSTYRLQSGVLAKHKGSFENPIMGWVPVFDFYTSNSTSHFPYSNNKADLYEYNQASFLKELLLGEFK